MSGNGTPQWSDLGPIKTVWLGQWQESPLGCLATLSRKVFGDEKRLKHWRSWRRLYHYSDQLPPRPWAATGQKMPVRPMALTDGGGNSKMLQITQRTNRHNFDQIPNWLDSAPETYRFKPRSKVPLFVGKHVERNLCKLSFILFLFASFVFHKISEQNKQGAGLAATCNISNLRLCGFLFRRILAACGAAGKKLKEIWPSVILNWKSSWKRRPAWTPDLSRVSRPE